MNILIALIGLILGLALSSIIGKIVYNIDKSKNKASNYIAAFICCISFLICYLRFGLNIIFIKAVIAACILIIVSLVDLQCRVIPNFIVIITLVLGIIFIFIGDVSLLDGLAGMLAGGGILFLLALIPNAMGGGDIKFMFAFGLFLGLYKTLWAMLLAFILASIISILLMLFKIIGRKDHIPFGPFLAFGGFLALIVFK